LVPETTNSLPSLVSWVQEEEAAAAVVAVVWACAEAATIENITAQAASTLAWDAGRGTEEIEDIKIT